jgi:hypothetical protein
MDERGYGCSGRILLSFLAIIFAIVSCIGTLTFLFDNACYNSMSKKIPIYPNARITLSQHNFIRPFGMGETLIMLDSDDPPDVVREWYGRTVGEAYRAVQAGSNDPFFYMANARYSISGATDGTGTQIILSGVCAN